MKLGHSPFDPNELSNKREEQRGKHCRVFLAVVIQKRRWRDREEERKREKRIKGKEDMVKTRAPKRLT